MKNPSHNIREIKEKLNVSSLEKVKLVQAEIELDTVETSALSEEQVTLLVQAEKKDEEEILSLTSTFIDTFELAEKQRKQEEKELALMSLQDKESKLYNKEIFSRVEIEQEDDDGFVLVQGKKNGTYLRSLLSPKFQKLSWGHLALRNRKLTEFVGPLRLTVTKFALIFLVPSCTT